MGEWLNRNLKQVSPERGRYGDSVPYTAHIHSGASGRDPFLVRTGGMSHRQSFPLPPVGGWPVQVGRRDSQQKEIPPALIRGHQSKGTSMTMTLANTPQLWDDEDGPRARLPDPITSHLAADSNGNRAQVAAAVLALFSNKSSGLTDEEMTHLYFHASHSPATHTDSPRKRRSGLAGRGLLVDVGIKRPTVSGRKSVAWVLA